MKGRKTMARINYPDYRGHRIYRDETASFLSVWVIGGGLLAGAPRTIEQAHALVDASIAEDAAFAASAEPYETIDEAEIATIVERLGR